MSSTLAILVFFVFILAGFVIEAQGRKKATLAVWLPWFWMVICASRSINQWLNLSNYSDVGLKAYLKANEAGSLVDQVVLSIAIACGIMILLSRKEATAELLKNNRALLAFTIYLGITVLWSDVHEASFRRWVRLTGNFVMAAVLMTEPEPMESVRSVFRRSAYVLIPLSVMLVKYFPQMGILYSRLGGSIWVGASLMKNGLGHLCFIFSFFFIWDVARSWWGKGEMKFSRTIYDAIILLMGLWLLRGASSAGSRGSLILGIVMLAGLAVPVIRRNFGKLGVLVILAAVLFLVLEVEFGIVEIVVTGLGRNMTFTDRVPLWNALIDVGLRKAFFGYGYGGFWTPERLEIMPEDSFGLTQAHDGYLEIFLEGGLVAMILLSLLLISVLRNIQKNGLIDYGYAIFRLCFLLMILSANVTESSLARERDLLTFVFYIIALNAVTPKANVGMTVPG